MSSIILSNRKHNGFHPLCTFGSPAKSTKPVAPKTPAKAFDHGKSHISHEVMRAWLERDVSGSLEDDKVPHVGPATIDKLREAGITTTFELIGRFFLEIDERGPQEGCDRYKAMLHAAGCPPAHLDSVVTAVLVKAASGNLRCPTVMSAERLASSRLDWEKMKKFLATPLTGDLSQDLMGLGKASVKALAELDPNTEVEGYVAAETGSPITVGEMTGLTTGVTTTWQLLGMGIVCKDADMFEALLKTVGVATGFRATVVHQVVERLNAGIKVPGLASAC